MDTIRRPGRPMPSEREEHEPIQKTGAQLIAEFLKGRDWTPANKVDVGRAFRRKLQVMKEMADDGRLMRRECECGRSYMYRVD